MKTRTGFVSNSSSTSFIVVLDHLNQHFKTYDWMVTETETSSKEQTNKRGVWDGTTYKSVDEETYLKELGFVVKREEWGFKIWERTIPILSTLETNGGRTTSICFGKDLLDYIEELSLSDGVCSLSIALEKAIAEHGLENVLFMRESDEGMGGYLPEALGNLTDSKQAIYQEEYH